MPTQPAPATVIELGCGPGVALAELLRAYPAARVIGADPSALVLASGMSALGPGWLTPLPVAVQLRARVLRRAAAARR